jgi:hypothetical protein
MELIKKQQIKDIYQLIKFLGKTPAEVIVEVQHFTEKRVKTVLLMNTTEANTYHSFLRDCNTRMEHICDKMRKKILSRYHEMGYTIAGKLDMPRVKESILKYGYLHKDLNKYTFSELPKLVYQVDNMLSDYLKAFKK